tara:strand:- start:1014 stop:1892 length:879 start_codon:yes stop_codon:yes gene_type:complete
VSENDNELKHATEINTQDKEIVYRRPLLAVICFRIVIAFRVVLPKSLFLCFYRFAFASYKFIYRNVYLARGIFSGKGEAMTFLIHDCMKYSLVGWEGMEATYQVTRRIFSNKISGDLVECGVAEGGSALLLCRLNEEYDENRQVWLFDSFEGLPEPTDDDFKSGKTGFHVRPLPKGSCLGTIENVSNLLFDKYRIDRSNVELVKGWFQDTLPNKASKIDQIAVLRLDGDWYESTKCCLIHLYSKVVPGGVVILDDYISCFGCKKATDEFLQENGIDAKIELDGRGGAWFLKP